MSCVTCHMTCDREWIWDIQKMMASGIFLKPGWLKDYNRTCDMCHGCHVTCHVSCVTCHMACDRVNLGHSENDGKCYIFVIRMTQGLQWDIWHVSQVSCHISCHVLHVTWHVTEWIWDIQKIIASAIFLKPGWLKDYSGTCNICHRCHVIYHVLHVTCHVTDWIWGIQQILASAIFLKPGWLKDYNGTCDMCLRCHVTFHIICYMSHVTCHKNFSNQTT